MINTFHSNGSEETQQPTQLYRAGKVISLLSEVQDCGKFIQYLFLIF